MSDLINDISLIPTEKATDSEMPFPIPNSCGECIYRHEFHSGYYCNNPTDEKRQMLDISAFKICLDTKPDWCPMEIIRQKINELSAEDRKLLDKVCAGFNAMFELIENMSNEK